MTYTYAILEVTDAAYKEIAKKLREAGYHGAFQKDDGQECIDNKKTGEWRCDRRKVEGQPGFSKLFGNALNSGRGYSSAPPTASGMIYRLILTLLASSLVVVGQTQTKLAPDCTLGPGVVSFTTTGNSTPFDNRPVSSNTGIPCTNWSLEWSAQPAVTSLTIQIQAAPDVAGVPGSYTSIATSSVFPNGKLNIATATGYYPWVRVSVTAVGSGGAIKGVLNGWRENADTIGGGGGGGGGGCTAPCVVIGPDAPGAAPTQSPVQISTTDGSGNVVRPMYCTLSAPITVTGSGLTQIVALSAGKQIEVCNISVSFASGVDFQLETGTGSNCGTSTTALTGLYKTVLTVALDFPFGTLNGTVSQALCINLGSSITGGGMVNYGLR